MQYLIAFALIAALVSGTDSISPASGAETTDAADVTSSILWSEGHEDGNNSGWSYVAISGSAATDVSTGRAHTGRYGNKLSIWGADGWGTSPGVRMEKHDGLPGYNGSQNLPKKAFYSVYYYFPQHVSHDGWFWNVFQWKRAYITDSGGHSLHPTWVVNVVETSSDRMTFMLTSAVGSDNKYRSVGTAVATAAIDVPVGKWVHLECAYTWSMSPDGRVTCWQDGVMIWDVKDVRTDLNYDYLFNKYQWTVNSYAGDTTPESHSIWIDDAAISSERLGPRWTEGISPTKGTCAGRIPTIVGTRGPDTIVGTPGPDVILARGGNDTIRGGGGKDIICGGRGRDVIRGEGQADVIRGGFGDDDIYGGRGGDRLRGGRANDSLLGGSGSDICVGGPGSDSASSCESRRTVP